MILGDPGSGKTTLLKHLAIKTANETKQLPIFIEIRIIASKSSFPEFESFLKELLPESQAPKSFFTRQLKQGNCIILLDAFDEVPVSRRKAIADWIEGITSKYPDNLFVASSRMVGFTVHLEGFEKFVITGFNDDMILSYLRNWTLKFQLGIQGDSPSARAKAEARAQQLSHIIMLNPSIRQLASNPFFLTIILLIYSYTARLPEKFGTLLDEIVNVMLESRDRAKKIGQHEISSSKTQYLLGQLALAMTESKVSNLDYEEIEKLLLGYLENLGIDSKQLWNVLREVSARSGLLVERREGGFGFSHFIFQEYFAATELARSHRGFEILSQHIDDDWWLEIVRLYAGLISDATNLIRTILEREQPVSPRNLILAAKCLVNSEYVESFLKSEISSQLKGLTGTDEDKQIEATHLLDAINGGRL